MSATKTKNDSQRQPVNLIRRRFRSALALREHSIEEVARRASVTTRHMHFVLDGQRWASASVLSAIREALGPSGWAFATGQADSLRDEGGDHVAG